MRLHALLHWYVLASAVAAGVFAAVAVARIRRFVALRPGSYVVIDLAGHIHDLAQPVRFWRRFIPRPRPLSVTTLRRVARQLNEDPRVAGVVVRLGTVGGGWATADSLRDVVASLRRGGKKVIFHARHGAGTREVYIAVAGDKVYASPQATLMPLGVAIGHTFYRGLLARGGIEAELLARKEFKGAAEPFTLDGYSEPNRAQTAALLESIHGAVVKAISEGRGLAESEAAALVDTGPFRPAAAVERKLIDGVAYEDELPTLLGVDRKQLVRLPRYLGLRPPAFFKQLRPQRGKRVGIVEVRGAIVAEAAMSLSRVADAERVVQALRAAREIPAVGAVVLYVDTPGGSASASDLIAREVTRLREKKPVVAYFADTAASGGYYVAAPANEIIAQPLTVTGSIGVFMLRFVVQRALEKLGIQHEVIRRGARADMMSPYRRWTDDERAVLDESIDGFYKDFVGIVAKGRGRSEEQVEPLARGRVYSGRDALKVGLVDSLGGLDRAIERAAELAKLVNPGDPVVVYPPGAPLDPPEPPKAVQPFVAHLGDALDAVNLALNAGHEQVFAFTPRLL